MLRGQKMRLDPTHYYDVYSTNCTVVIVSTVLVRHRGKNEFYELPNIEALTL